jgi:nucleotide sugar dehydrogenase
VKIQIIGLGTVGRAQVHLMEALGHKVYGYDVNHPLDLPPRLNLKKPKRGVDLTFICTNEDSLEAVMQALKDCSVDGLYVIKSTTIPGTTEKLAKNFDVHICHNPEFLRETSYIEDVVNPDRIIIGKCCNEHAKVLRKLYEPLGKPTLVVRSLESEIIKLVSNAYLSTLITFWNEISSLAHRNGVDVMTVSNGVTLDSRMSKYGTVKFGEPFDGKCLPKDLRHLIEAFHMVGLRSPIFESVEKINEELRGRHLIEAFHMVGLRSPIFESVEKINEELRGR